MSSAEWPFDLFCVVACSIASEKCQQEKRKTINGEDLLWAMSTLGFDKYVEPLKLYLQKYKEVSRTAGGLVVVHARLLTLNCCSTS